MRSASEVARLCAAVLALGMIVAACDGGAIAPPPQAEPVAPRSQRQVPPLELPAEELGEHLELSQFKVGLMEGLAVLQDPILSALPGRKLDDDGRIYNATAGSQTGETFWMHVVIDVSAGSARDWVQHLAALPSGTALSFTRPSHDLVEADSRLLPSLGSMALFVDLLHGHSGGRWRTELIVFAQEEAIVFLGSSRREQWPTMLDLEAIAQRLSSRLFPLTARESAAE